MCIRIISILFVIYGMVELGYPNPSNVELTVSKRQDDRLKIVQCPIQFSADFPMDQNQKLNQVLKNDLNFSGHFIVDGNQSVIENLFRKDANLQSLNPQNWENLNSDIVLKSMMRVEVDRIYFDGYAFDKTSGRTVLAKRYTGTLKLANKVLHQFSDDLIETLTGFKGICNLKLVYVQAVTKDTKEIFLSDYDGENKVQITKDQTLIMSPRFNPKSFELIYTTYKTGFPTVMLHQLKSGHRSILARFPGFNGSATFSPDGQKIALVLSKDGNPEIYIMNRDKSNLQRLTKSRSVDESPVWSPNGQKIAFVSDRRGSVQIYQMDLKNQNIDRITFQGSYNTSPAWSPLGDKIAYTQMRRGKGEIYIADLTTGEHELIASGEDPDWAPDGRHLTYIDHQNGLKQIFIIDAPTKIRRQITFAHQNCLTPSWTLY